MLEQSTAVYPLPRILCPFLVITRGASQDEVRHVISRDICTSNPRKRERMIDMENVLPFPVRLLDSLESGKTTGGIVAAILLALQLLLYLLGRMSACNSFQTCSSLMGIDSSLVFMCSLVVLIAFRISLIRAATILSILFRVSQPMRFSALSMLLSMRMSISTP